MLYISKERFHELGLGFDLECCKECDDCVEINGELHCRAYREMPIKMAQRLLEIAPCIDEERVKMEMTDVEYDAFRHGRLGAQ